MNQWHWEPPWREPINALQDRVAEVVRPFVEFQERVAERVRPIVERLPEWAEQARLFAERFEESLRAAYPTNWLHLEAEDVIGAGELMTKQGLNVAWVPRVGVVRELLTAPDAEAREQVMHDREAEILDDIRRSLAATSHPELVEPVNALAEAVGSFGDGRYRSAQALATVTLGTLIHDAFGDSKFADARRKFEAFDPEEAPLQEFRLSAVLRCVARALEPTTVAGPGFNRHASAHRVSTDQYTRTNALASLMLVAGVLRELDFWFGVEDENDQQAVQAA
jgi:hypothetical protein